MTAAVRRFLLPPYPGRRTPAGSGLPTHAGRPARLGDRLEAAQLELRRTPRALLGQLMATALVAGVFRHIDPEGNWASWFAATAVLLCLARLWIWWRFARQLEARGAFLLRWDRLNGGLILLQGLLTGVACAAVQPSASAFEQAILLMVVFACVLAAAPALIDRPAVLLVHAAATAGPMATAVLLDRHHPEHLPLVGSVVLLVGLLAWTVSSLRAAFVRIRRLKDRADSLRRSVSGAARRAEQARVEAEIGDQFKTQLLAAASHDLRQPITALRLYELQLRSGPSEPLRLAALHGLRQGIEALDIMVHDLLNVAARQRGTLVAVPQWIELERVYARLRPQLAPSAFDRGLDLRWRGGHLRAWADPDMLERCLRNLLTNAVDHTQDGGVLVAARLRSTHLLLQVWDSGCGLSPDLLARITDPGSAPGVSRARAGAGADGGDGAGGRGLGLSIVRQLAHLMGAQTRVRSRLGQGTVFELLLPLSPRDEEAAGSAPGSTPRS